MLKLSRREGACDVSSKRWTPGAAAAASSIARADLAKINLENFGICFEIIVSREACFGVLFIVALHREPWYISEPGRAQGTTLRRCSWRSEFVFLDCEHVVYRFVSRDLSSSVNRAQLSIVVVAVDNAR
jgi:hypothetical protein